MKTNKFNIPVYDNINDYIIYRNCIEYWYNFKTRWINYNIFGIRIKRNGNKK